MDEDDIDPEDDAFDVLCVEAVREERIAKSQLTDSSKMMATLAELEYLLVVATNRPWDLRDVISKRIEHFKEML